MFNWSLYTGNLAWLQDRTILMIVAGSHAYGMNTPESDEDYAGIAIPPAEYFHGYLKHFDQAVQHEPVDLTVYGIQKFFELASAANPNVLELLFLDPADYLILTDVGKTLLEHRHLFLSQKARWTYSGYATAQLKRIVGHKAWLMNPREQKPSRAEFDLPETSVLSADILGAIDAVQKTNETLVFPTHVMEIYRRERAYQNALREYQQYQNWKKTRNPKRAKLEEKFGYDSKHASHLVRLIRTGKELLATGQLNVKRPDAEELLAIRQGAWTYEQVVSYAEGIDAEMDILQKSSPLPHSPNRNALDELCQELVERMIG